MKAKPVFREKRLLLHRKTGGLAVAEVKVWSIPRSKEYPQGRKFSLFLVAEGSTVVGIDNHSPKGPHLHLGDREHPYDYGDESQLLADFWDLVRKAGYDP